MEAPQNTQDFENLQNSLFQTLISATKSSNKFPQGENFAYYSGIPGFEKDFQSLDDRVLRLIENLLIHEKEESTFTRDGDHFDTVIDVVDNLVEKVDTYIDTAQGNRAEPKILITRPASTNLNRGKSEEKDMYIFHAANIARPQLKFTDKIDNTPNPWIPKLPLGKAWKGRPPFEEEVTNLQYLPHQLMAHPAGETTPLGECQWIDTLEGLQSAAKALAARPIIAVDLEQHSYRSFQGFVCLMQITSDDGRDYIVDTLALREHIGPVLGPIFSNPAIVKVLHGADSDIIWLQRDFGIFIVNMFDTGQASRVLDLPRFSLAYLLQQYCNVVADKQYQLADWRIRPIPEEMIRYAQSDTHYLLYIYRRMVSDLIARGNPTQNLLKATLSRSNALTLNMYEKEIMLPTHYLQLYSRLNLNLNENQTKVFRELLMWRDHVAREEDESTRYVLPNHMLVKIATVIPRFPDDLFKCCAPTVPPLIHVYATDILMAIERVLSDSSTFKLNEVPMSPVLTTDQLYRTAGWVEDWVPQIRPGNAVISSGFSNTGILFDEESDDDDDDDEEFESQKADLIHNQLLTQLFPLESEPREFPIEEPTSKKEEAPKKVPTESAQPSKDSVPQSMSEIYKLSNQIKRKRNKERKKGVEKKEEDEEEEEESASRQNNTKRPKQPSKKDTDASTPTDFMKELGWIEESKEEKTAEKPNTTAAKPAAPKAPAKFTKNAKPFQPFDYGNQPHPLNAANSKPAWKSGPNRGDKKKNKH
eukprot:TRINITY_DN500_c8_g1_i1.p1 TRINITY_DN500_c8_g1~~TRINITY_DN500_c8_g1_i1.p1  ORF type:complete len:786 (-),score=221.82 TRINITY_DN500_c8_g1_i1:148-2421(-)